MIVLHLSHEEKLAIILIALILLFLSLILSICLASPVCLLNQWLDERLKQRKIIARQQQHQLLLANSLVAAQTQTTTTQTTTTTTAPRQTLVGANDFSAPKTLTVANNDADNISIIIRAQNQAPPSYDKAVQLDCNTAPSVRHYNENIQLAGTVHYQVDKRLAGCAHHTGSLLCNALAEANKPAAIKKQPQLIDPANYADYFHQPEGSGPPPVPADAGPPGAARPLFAVPAQALTDPSGRKYGPTTSPMPLPASGNCPLAIPPITIADQAAAAAAADPDTNGQAGKVGPILMRFWLDVLEEADELEHQRLHDHTGNHNHTDCAKAPGAAAAPSGSSPSAAVSLEDLSSLSSGQSSESSNCSNCSNKELGQLADGEAGADLRRPSVAVSDENKLTINDSDSVIDKPSTGNNYLGVYGVNIAGYTINSTTTTPTGLTLCMPKIVTAREQPDQQQQQTKDNNGAKRAAKQKQMIRFKVSICDIENLTQQHLHNYLTSVNNSGNGNHINNYSNHTSSFTSSHIYVQCDLMAPTRSRYLRPMIPMSSKMRDARPVVTFRTISQRLFKVEDHHMGLNQSSSHSGMAARGTATGTSQRPLSLAPITVCPIYQPINATFVTPKLASNLLSEGCIRMRIFIENKHVNDVCVAQLKLPISSVMKGTQQQQQQQQLQQQQQTVTSISSSINTAPDCSSSSGCSSMTLQVEPFEHQQQHHLALSYECEMLHEIKGQTLLGLSYLPTSNRVIINAYRASVDDTDKDLKKLLLQTGNSYFLRFMMMVNGRVIKKKRTPVVTRQNLAGQQQTKLFWDSQESITFDLVNINVDQPDFVVVLILRQQQPKQQQQQPQLHQHPHQQPEQQEVANTTTANDQSVGMSTKPMATTASNFAKRFMMLTSHNNNSTNSIKQPTGDSATQLRSSASVGNIRQSQHNIHQQTSNSICQHNDNDSGHVLANVNQASFYNSEPEQLSLKRYLSGSENHNDSEAAAMGGGQAKRRRDLVIGHVVLGETIWQDMKSQPRRQIKREFLLY